jgi:hypothetical protein
MTTETTKAFFGATSAMVSELVERLKRDDLQAHSAVSTVLQRGGFLTMHVAFGTAGLIQSRLTLVGPDGERVTLMSLDEDAAPRVPRH